METGIFGDYIFCVSIVPNFKHINKKGLTIFQKFLLKQKFAPGATKISILSLLSIDLLTWQVQWLYNIFSNNYFRKTKPHTVLAPGRDCAECPH